MDCCFLWYLMKMRMGTVSENLEIDVIISVKARQVISHRVLILT